MNSVALRGSISGYVVNRILIYQEVQMGGNISEADIAAGNERIQAIRAKRQKLAEELEAKEFIKGTVTARSESFTSISESESKNSILEAVGNLLKAYTKGDVTMVFDVIGQQVQALASTTKSGETVIEEFKGFPLMTPTGFSMVFFHFYMEKMFIQKKDAKYEQTILMNVFKIITPAPPKNRYQLGGYLNAAKVDQATREKIFEGIWDLILQTKTTQELEEFLKRAELIDKIKGTLKKK